VVHEEKIQDVEAIRGWLVDKLAEALCVSPEEIEDDEPFARYGLGSAQAVSMAGDLEEWVGRDLPATLLYDYPTIDALAHHVSEASAVTGRRGPSGDVSFADDS
jgi:acyl carrier protein